MELVDTVILGTLATSLTGLFIWNFKRSVDLGTRVAVLESKVSEIPETLKVIKDNIREIYRINTDTCMRLTRIETILDPKTKDDEEKTD